MIICKWQPTHFAVSRTGHSDIHFLIKLCCLWERSLVISDFLICNSDFTSGFIYDWHGKLYLREKFNFNFHSRLPVKSFSELLMLFRKYDKCANMSPLIVIWVTISKSEQWKWKIYLNGTAASCHSFCTTLKWLCHEKSMRVAIAISLFFPVTNVTRTEVEGKYIILSCPQNSRWKEIFQ